MENFKPVIGELEERAKASQDVRLKKWLTSSINLLRELDARGIEPRNFDDELKMLKKQLSANTKTNMIRTFYLRMVDAVRKQFDLTTPNYFQSRWTALGILVFGIPLGLVFSMSIDNYAFLGMGIPVGLAIGIAIGADKDKKAKEAGKLMEI